jgi:oxygen-dependent protoporphyrinogen oxidase
MKVTQAVVIGGGITGLSAAWTLQKAGISYALLEKEPRFGGKIITGQIDSAEGISLIDGGPESFVTRKPEVWELAHELGLEESIIVPQSETSGMHILHEGVVYPVPLQPLAFLRSKIMSLRGKLRMLREPFIAPRMDDADESLASFVRRRLGDEALQRFIGPVLGGIYNANPEEQSILYTSPIMRELETVHGSLVKGQIATMRRRREQRKTATTPLPPRFIAFRHGSQELVSALLQQLSGDLYTSTTIRNIEKHAAGYRISLEEGDVIETQVIILATPANAAAHLLKALAPDASDKLREIRHGNIGTISLLYRSDELPAGLEVRGLMIPRKEKRAIDAITWTSTRIPDRAPEGYTLIRVFFGGGAPQLVQESEKEIAEVVQAELQALLEIRASPLDFRVYRWIDSYPRADVGHLTKVDQIEELLPVGIYLAGASYRGLGVPDCVQQGKSAAQTALSLIHSIGEMQAEPAL